MQLGTVPFCTLLSQLHDNGRGELPQDVILLGIGNGGFHYEILNVILAAPLAQVRGYGDISQGNHYVSLAVLGIISVIVFRH